jgi:formylglycine-generating enzyme required for sulfatase activity
MAEGFWVGRNEVTQAEYVAVRGDNPSRYLGEARHPVERVNWQEAMDYCSDLTVRERAAGHLPDGYAYRLPTEAEWEYVCRAGTSTRFSHGDDPAFTLVREFAWINGNSDSTTHPVGTRKANPWGLHDLHGNVCEWCLDDWHGSHPGGTVTNTPVLPSGTLRIARGGSWLYEPRFARSANRDSYGMLNRCSDVGFRIVLAGSPSNTAPRTDIR